MRSSSLQWKIPIQINVLSDSEKCFTLCLWPWDTYFYRNGCFLFMSLFKLSFFGRMTLVVRGMAKVATVLTSAQTTARYSQSEAVTVVFWTHWFLAVTAFMLSHSLKGIRVKSKWISVHHFLSCLIYLYTVIFTIWAASTGAVFSTDRSVCKALAVHF